MNELLLSFAPRAHLGLLVVALVSLGACASGSGRSRGGSGLDGGRDAGPTTALDAGPMTALDAGPMTALDAGPMTVLDAGPMTTMDAGGADGGMTLVRDAGPRIDAGPPGCTSAAECQNGIACDGTERCEGGACVAGTPIVCDDGIACTTNACVEPGTCAYMPNDALCGGGQSCDPARGCVAGCAESPCRLVSPQCGCPSGQGCYVDGAGTRTCATAGTASEGQSCTGTTSCRAGNLCINVSSTGTANICSRFCSTDADCATGALCLITLSGSGGGPLPGVTLCTHACDPVRQTGCATGTACDVFGETTGLMRTFTDCAAPVGAGGQGAFCTDNGDCRAGFACIDPDGPGGFGSECMHWCEPLTGAGCTAGLTCYGFTTPLRVNGREIGVCDF